MKNKKNILIIEPNRIAGLDLQLRLEKKGFSVQRPISLVDTEVLIATHPPDLIVADTAIKTQSIFRRIIKYLEKFQLPFIWIGAKTKKESIREGDKIKVIGIFTKPLSGSKIVAQIVRYFSTKHTRIVPAKAGMM